MQLGLQTISSILSVPPYTKTNFTAINCQKYFRIIHTHSLDMYSCCQPRPKNKQNHLWACSSFNASCLVIIVLSSCSVNNFILTEIGTLWFAAELILGNSPIKLRPYSFSFKPHKLLPESTHTTLKQLHFNHSCLYSSHSYNTAHLLLLPHRCGSGQRRRQEPRLHQT